MLVCVCVCECAHVYMRVKHATLLMWKSEDSLLDSFLSFGRVHSRNWAHAIRIGSGSLYPHNHLTDPEM